MNKFLIITLLSVLALTYVNSVSIQISGLAKESTNATVECELCALTVNATEYLIKHENYTQKQVEAELKKICTVVPSNMTKECDLFMLIAAPVITKGLFDGESGTELCAKYHMCPKSEEYKSVTTQFIEKVKSVSHEDRIKHIKNVVQIVEQFDIRN